MVNLAFILSSSIIITIAKISVLSFVEAGGAVGQSLLSSSNASSSFSTVTSSLTTATYSYSMFIFIVLSILAIWIYYKSVAPQVTSIEQIVELTFEAIARGDARSLRRARHYLRTIVSESDAVSRSCARILYSLSKYLCFTPDTGKRIAATLSSSLDVQNAFHNNSASIFQFAANNSTNLFTSHSLNISSDNLPSHISSKSQSPHLQQLPRGDHHHQEHMYHAGEEKSSVSVGAATVTTAKPGEQSNTSLGGGQEEQATDFETSGGQPHNKDDDNVGISPFGDSLLLPLLTGSSTRMSMLCISLDVAFHELVSYYERREIEAMTQAQQRQYFEQTFNFSSSGSPLNFQTAGSGTFSASANSSTTNDLLLDPELEEALPPVPIQPFFEIILENIRSCVQEHGGNVEHFTGDYVFISFNNTLVRPNPNHAVTAAECAVSLNRRLRAIPAPTGAMLIGLATATASPVIVGRGFAQRCVVAGGQLTSRACTLCRFGRHLLFDAVDEYSQHIPFLPRFSNFKALNVYIFSDWSPDRRAQQIFQLQQLQFQQSLVDIGVGYAASPTDSNFTASPVLDPFHVVSYDFPSTSSSQQQQSQQSQPASQQILSSSNSPIQQATTPLVAEVPAEGETAIILGAAAEESNVSLNQQPHVRVQHQKSENLVDVTDSSFSQSGSPITVEKNVDDDGLVSISKQDSHSHSHHKLKTTTTTTTSGNDDKNDNANVNSNPNLSPSYHPLTSAHSRSSAATTTSNTTTNTDEKNLNNTTNSNLPNTSSIFSSHVFGETSTATSATATATASKIPLSAKISVRGYQERLLGRIITDAILSEGITTHNDNDDGDETTTNSGSIDKLFFVSHFIPRAEEIFALEDQKAQDQANENKSDGEENNQDQHQPSKEQEEENQQQQQQQEMSDIPLDINIVVTEGSEIASPEQYQHFVEEKPHQQKQEQEVQEEENNNIQEENKDKEGSKEDEEEKSLELVLRNADDDAAANSGAANVILSNTDEIAFVSSGSDVGIDFEQEQNNLDNENDDDDQQQQQQQQENDDDTIFNNNQQQEQEQEQQPSSPTNDVTVTASCNDEVDLMDLEKRGYLLFQLDQAKKRDRLERKGGDNTNRKKNNNKNNNMNNNNNINNNGNGNGNNNNFKRSFHSNTSVTSPVFYWGHTHTRRRSYNSSSYYNNNRYRGSVSKRRKFSKHNDNLFLKEQQEEDDDAMYFTETSSSSSNSSSSRSSSSAAANNNNNNKFEGKNKYDDDEDFYNQYTTSESEEETENKSRNDYNSNNRSARKKKSITIINKVNNIFDEDEFDEESGDDYYDNESHQEEHLGRRRKSFKQEQQKEGAAAKEAAATTAATAAASATTGDDDRVSLVTNPTQQQEGNSRRPSRRMSRRRSSMGAAVVLASSLRASAHRGTVAALAARHRSSSINFRHNSSKFNDNNTNTSRKENPLTALSAPASVDPFTSSSFRTRKSTTTATNTHNAQRKKRPTSTSNRKQRERRKTQLKALVAGATLPQTETPSISKIQYQVGAEIRNCVLDAVAEVQLFKMMLAQLEENFGSFSTNNSSSKNNMNNNTNNSNDNETVSSPSASLFSEIKLDVEKWTEFLENHSSELSIKEKVELLRVISEEAIPEFKF